MDVKLDLRLDDIREEIRKIHAPIVHLDLDPVDDDTEVFDLCVVLC